MITSNITIDNVIRPCSLCKNKNTGVCNICISAQSMKSEIQFGNYFSPDVSQLDEQFIYEYYELLNAYIKIISNFSNLGLNIKVHTIEKDT